MAEFDASDLLDRLRDALRRPATDQVLTPERGYRLLSDAQREVAGTLAQHIPWVNYGDPVQLVTTNNQVYTLPNDAEWMGRILLMRDLTGEPLIEGSYDDLAADYCMEGVNGIRITGGREWGSDAPYARYMARPSLIDASTEPTLKPTQVRVAIVYTAAAMFARRGGGMDPQPYLDEVYACLWGREGWAAQPGLIPSYKNQQAGLVTLGQPWWRGVGTIR